MSENSAGFNPFNNEGSDPKIDAYKWGFNFKSIKGANTDLTYGWKASGVTGLATSIYVSPVALAPYAAASAGITAIAGGDGTAVGASALTGPALAASPFVATALANMVFSTELVYKGLLTSCNVIFPGSMTSNPKISMRYDYLMRQAAYMTVEVGAKKDFILGNKYDFCTGTVNKTVNGETVICHADKVEWYYANLYKYIQGTETKMESKKLGSQLVGGKQNLTQVEVLKDKSKYAENYTQHGDYLDAKAAKDKTDAAGGDLKQTAGGQFSVTAKSAKHMLAEDVTFAAGGDTSIDAFGDVKLGSTSGKISLSAGVNPSVEISTGETKINNKLNLGTPGFGAIPDVSGAMAAYAAAQAAAAADLAKTKAKLLDLYCDLVINDVLAV